jgi:hypothetical protein
MQKIIVNNWKEVPFIDMQIRNFTIPNEAFKYAEHEYFPYGYNLAYFSTDINTLFLTKN